jgi:4-amino-4-deoxy-L-arabinose transferase-like glycosyltransferase
LWRDLIALGIVALAFRVVASLLTAEPAYLDAAYYELVARRVADGHGLTVPVIWSFLDTGGVLPADPHLPIPSNRHWMPMTGLVSAASMAVLGTSRFAAELPHALIGAALVPATAWIAWWLWGSRRVAIASGVLALFAGPMLVYVPMVDSFALFGAFGMVAIVAAIAASRAGASGWWIVGSAACVALATLTRVDGLILSVAPATAWLARRRIGPWMVPGSPLSAWWAVAAVGAALLLLAPWLARQAAEFGSAWPSAGGRLLWLTDYNAQFSITADASPAALLAEGVPALVVSRIDAFVQVMGRTAVLLGGFFLAPLLYGVWRERRRADLAPFLAYWVALFVVMVLLFTVHAPAGAWYHSAWAWLPFAIPLAVASTEPLLVAVGRRVPMLARPRNVRFLTFAAMAGAVLLSLVGSAVLITQWERDGRKVEAAAAFLLENAERDDVVMYVDPPSLNLLTGNPTVAPPFDQLPFVRQVAEAYDVRWVVVERATGATTDALRMWNGADWLNPEPAFEEGDVRVYGTN